MELTVVIADDDRFMLQNLLNVVNWHNLGFRVVATATNGKSALNAINKFHPQILITDIIMPAMNGLDLIKCVRDTYPEMKVLIISSYDEFEYAKEAIEKGVTDYILKTEINAFSFSAKLSSLYAECTSQSRIRSTVLKQEFTNMFDDSTASGSEQYYTNVYPLLSSFLKQRFQFYIVTQLTGFCHHTQDAVDYSKKSSQILYNSLLLMDEVSMSPILFPYKHFCILGILVESNRANQDYVVKACSRKILLNLRRIPEPSCMLFYSNASITLVDLLAFFRKFETTLDFYSSFHIASELSFDEIESNTHNLVEKSFPFKNLSFDKEHLKDDINQLNDFLYKSFSDKNYPTIFRFYQNFCTQIEIVSNNGICVSEQKLFPSLKDLQNWTASIYEQCIFNLNNSQMQEFSPHVKSAVNYIQENYSNHVLTLEDISASVELSPGRLGVLFKQETGRTINDFLTETRIKNATYFLSTTNMKIYEISDKCGYKSSQYFSQIFYQKTGKKPIDYRKMHH